MALILIMIAMTSLYTASGLNYRFSHPSSKIMTINADPNLGYVNVKSAPYNATGNGVTDDTNAIQQALNDIGAMGDGIVFVPEGNYLIASHLVVPASTVLKGVASHVQRDWGDPS